MALILNSTIAEKNVSIATEYFRIFYGLTAKDRTYSGGTNGFIPFKISLNMDGISGLKIYQTLRINTSFLPPGYPTTSDFIITGINHKLKDNDWETDLNILLIPKFEEFDQILTTDNFTYVQYVAPTTPDISQSTPTINAPTGNAAEREYFIFQYLKTIGWSKIQIAATLGNIEHETIRTFSPEAFNDRDFGGTTDIGIIQWNSGNDPNNPGQADLTKSKQMLLAQYGDTLEKQLNYLVNSWTNTNRWLNNPSYHPDVATSTFYFAKIVEVCHKCNSDRATYEGSYQFSRTTNAEKIYLRFNNPNDKLYWP
jgi:hypothetical protein